MPTNTCPHIYAYKSVTSCKGKHSCSRLRCGGGRGGWAGKDGGTRFAADGVQVLNVQSEASRVLELVPWEHPVLGVGQLMAFETWFNEPDLALPLPADVALCQDVWWALRAWEAFADDGGS